MRPWPDPELEIPAILRRYPDEERTPDMAKMAENTIEGRSKPFIDRIERLVKELESERGAYMAACKPLREDIKEIYGEAKEAGIPAKSLRQTIKYRELERKQKALAEGLDIDEQATFEQLVAAFGGHVEDGGQAAFDLAGTDDAAGGEDEDVRPRFKREEQAPAVKPKGRKKPASPAAEHAQALAGGGSDAFADAEREVEEKGISAAVGDAVATFETTH